jgi:hypothetical protein
LLSRADAALYSAKTAGRNLVFRHTGQLIEAAAVPAPRPAIEESKEDNHEILEIHEKVGS